MKKLTRLFTLLVLVAVLAVPTVSTFAQDGENPLCAGLTAEDCNLLTAPTTMMAEVSSVTMENWSLSFTLSLPADTTGGMMDATPDPMAEPEMQTVTFNANGSSGGVSMDPEADIRLYLMVDEATMSDGEETQTLSAELVVTQDMAYVNYNGQWYGGTLEEAGITVEDLDEVEGMVASGSSMDMSELGMDLTGVMTTTRVEDSDMMGQQLATFMTEVNITQLLVAALSSPAAGELLGGEEAGMSAEDVQMMGMFLQPMLAGTTLSTEQAIGVDDNYLHHLAVDLTLALDMSMLLPEIGAIDGELHIASDFMNYNEMLSATVPDDYLPLEQLEEDANLDLEGSMEDLGM